MIDYGKYVLPYMIKSAEKYGIKYEMNKTQSGKCVLFDFNGRKIILWDFPFNINPSASVKVCMNKDVCTYFLDKLGYSVPKSENFTRKSTEKNSDLIPYMMDFLSQIEASENVLNYPLILKPSNLSQGQGIFKIENREDALRAFEHLDEYKTKTFILQEFCKGNDYRVVVLGDKVIQAYQRIPFHIEGNGIDCVEDLVKAKSNEFINYDRDKEIDLADERIWNLVKSQGYLKKSVLKKGEILNLQSIANLSLGGSAKDVTNDISPYYIGIAKGVAAGLNLDMCGVDFIADDLTSEKNRNHKILEVNSAPGLDNYLYPEKEKQEEYVEELYDEVFLYLMDKYSENVIEK